MACKAMQDGFDAARAQLEYGSASALAETCAAAREGRTVEVACGVYDDASERIRAVRATGEAVQHLLNAGGFHLEHRTCAVGATHLGGTIEVARPVAH